MNRQLTRLFLVALLISLSLSFTPYSSSASSLKDEASKRSAFHDAMRLPEQCESKELAPRRNEIDDARSPEFDHERSRGSTTW